MGWRFKKFTQDLPGHLLVCVINVTDFALKEEFSVGVLKN